MMVFVGFSYGTSKSILDSLKAVYGQRYLIKLKVYGCRLGYRCIRPDLIGIV